MDDWYRDVVDDEMRGICISSGSEMKINKND
jgi:hypothetical protein